MNRAFIFDVFGTLVDWREGVATVARSAFGERSIDADPHAFADHWRGRYQPAMERVRNGGRGYVPLDTLHRENLDETLAAFDLEAAFDGAARDDLNRAWEKLPPWPDVRVGLDGLRRHGLLAPCSNGSTALMTRLSRFGDLRWDAIVGADIARDYKPKLEVYRASARALGLEPEQVTMVAAHNDDLTAARAAGLHTAFIPRPAEHGPGQTKDLKATDNWDFVSDDLVHLAGVVAQQVEKVT